MKRAPGPKGALIWGSLTEFSADSLGFLAEAAHEHGDIVRMRFGPVTVHLLNHPEYVEHVLTRNASNYDKNTRSAHRIAATTGDSLLSANQVAWKRHRKLVQPGFQPSNFTGIEPALDRLIEPMLERWQLAGEVDIVDEMMQLVIAAVIEVLFSSSIDTEKLNAALEVVLADTWRRIEAPLDASLLSPRLHRPAFKAALKEIDGIVLELILARRSSTQRPDDVLTRLLAAHEGAGETHLSDTELRDATVTLLLSGHETTANALSWAFIRASSGGHEAADPATIFAEAIRLYPSIWVIERRAVEADTIGGYHIPRGSSVLISPYLMHRHPKLWHDPERFDPARFAGDHPRARDGCIPFGLGEHRCVGLYLANTIGAHVLNRVFARFRLKLLPDQGLGLSPGITLRHEGPVRMRLHKEGDDV
ncbi:cytochrome P450 [Lentibacter algarum]|uniref:cytochrome P450 n=1 Tax=Lentibacter algarum TaxID=576131 RepID=UPI001C079F7F|nr:cytochrome P450 [Lentibacter algarum]MBU2981685.1 cytochrome P450 [Lentibacter algarum]